MIRFLMLTTFLAGSIGAACWFVGPDLWASWVESDGAVADVAARFHRVEPASLSVDFTAMGTLEAREHHQIVFPLKTQTQATVLSIVEQGTEVKAGDELLRLDPQPMLDKFKLKEKELQAAQEKIPLCESWVKVESSAAESTITGTEEMLQESVDKLKKFRQWDAPNEFGKLDDQITKAIEERDTATKAHRDALEAADEVSFGDDEKRVAAEKAAAASKEKLQVATDAVDRAELQKRIYQTYNYPDQLKALEQSIVKARLDLEKVRLTTKADMERAKSDLAVARENVRKIEKEMDELQKDLDSMVLRAPTDGIVLYADHQRDLKVGGTAYKGPLINIPQSGDYKISIEVGEHMRPRLEVNARTIVAFEAIKGMTLEGRLSSISRYASQLRKWDPSSPRIFRGVVELDGSDERLISGLTAKVRIIVEEIPRCLTVPIESLFNEDGKVVCYVRTGNGPERRVVTTGQSNDDFVEITAGLSAGDMVYTDHPMDTPAAASTPSELPIATRAVDGD